jgi:hypothetical protein
MARQSTSRLAVERTAAEPTRPHAVSVSPSTGPAGVVVDVQAFENLIGVLEVWFGHEEAKILKEEIDDGFADATPSEKPRFLLRVEVPTNTDEMVEIRATMHHGQYTLGHFKYSGEKSKD